MKILLISNMYPSKDDIFYGIFVKNFEESLIKDDINVKRVAIEGRGKSKFEKIKKYLYFFSDIIKSVLRNEYDLIYVHYAKHPLFPFLFVKFLLNKPLVINVHGDDIFNSSFITKILSNLIKNCTMLVAPSLYFKDFAYKKYNHTNIFISPSGGINTKIFKPIKKDIKSDIFTFGYVSRIDEGKGWDILLEAVSNLKKKNIKFKVLIIGGGLQENLFQQKLSELDLKEYVTYLGTKKHEELPHYFNMMDIFIFPTKLNESLGLVGLEAMACGIPVLGSNIGGLPTYIKNGENGWLFEPGNVNDLEEKILKCLSLNEKQLSEFSKKAYETAKEYDSRLVNNKLKEKLVEIFDKDKNEIKS